MKAKRFFFTSYFRKLYSVQWVILHCTIAFILSQYATASTVLRGNCHAVDGCEGGFDNGKHKAGEWRRYCNGWRYLYPGYHEVTLRKREAGYATDNRRDHGSCFPAFGNRAGGESPERMEKATPVKTAWSWPAENYASLDDRGHGGNYAKGSSYKGFTGSGYVTAPRGTTQAGPMDRRCGYTDRQDWQTLFLAAWRIQQLWLSRN